MASSLTETALRQGWLDSAFFLNSHMPLISSWKSISRCSTHFESTSSIA
jgi:hypothetical protein